MIYKWFSCFSDGLFFNSLWKFIEFICSLACWDRPAIQYNKNLKKWWWVEDFRRWGIVDRVVFGSGAQDREYAKCQNDKNWQTIYFRVEELKNSNKNWWYFFVEVLIFERINNFIILKCIISTGNKIRKEVRGRQGRSRQRALYLLFWLLIDTEVLWGGKYKCRKIQLMYRTDNGEMLSSRDDLNIR